MNSETTSLLNYLSPQAYRSAKAEKLKRESKAKNPWPAEYTNSETGKTYKPHHDEENAWVYDTSKRYLLAKGGEGGGKSVAGIIRDLERIKAGCHGIMVSPDFEHFKRSLWPEFRRWCPWEFVVEKQRYRQSVDWEPGRPFQLVFITGAVVYCGGIKESDIEAWEGPNVNWAHFDEPRRHKTAKALKVLDGRVRIPMGGYMPQMWLTSTPRMNWLFKYFGPWRGKGEDPRAAFKEDAHVVTLLTKDNEDNLEPGFVQKRAQTLTQAEVRVYLEAEWEDVDETQQYLPSMTLWDLCDSQHSGGLPPLTPHEPMVLALDAPEGTNEQGNASSFGMVGVTRHPDHHDWVACRFVREWKAPIGGILDFKGKDGPEHWVRYLCANFNVVQVAYDAYNLHSMVTELNKLNIAWFNKFPQTTQRLEADKQLLDLIIQRRLVHKGDEALRTHIKNANRKLADDGKRLRIVKREPGLNVDLAVCLSMASFECLRLNV